MVRLRHLLCFLLLLPVIPACSPAGSADLDIGFSPDSGSIVFRNIDQAGLLQLKQAGLTDTALNDLIAVLQTPSEGDPGILEMPVAGRIHITDSTIVFHPDTSFVKGRDYLVITHLNARFADARRMAGNQLSTQVKPLQKLLTR